MIITTNDKILHELKKNKYQWFIIIFFHLKDAPLLPPTLNMALISNYNGAIMQ